MKFGRRKIGEIVRYLPAKNKIKISPASQTVATAENGAQNVPGPNPNNVLRVLQTSSKSVHCRRRVEVIAESANAAKLRPKVIPILVSKHSSEANNNNHHHNNNNKVHSWMGQNNITQVRSIRAGPGRKQVIIYIAAPGSALWHVDNYYFTAASTADSLRVDSVAAAACWPRRRRRHFTVMPSKHSATECGGLRSVCCGLCSGMSSCWQNQQQFKPPSTFTRRGRIRRTCWRTSACRCFRWVKARLAAEAGPDYCRCILYRQCGCENTIVLIYRTSSRLHAYWTVPTERCDVLHLL